MNNIDKEVHNNLVRKRNILKLVDINDITVRNIINKSASCRNNVEKNECNVSIRIPKKSHKGLLDYSDIQIKNTIEKFIEADATVHSVYVSDFDRPSPLSHGSIKIHFYKKSAK